MRRNNFSQNKTAQRGFSIVLAVFIILVGGLLAGALINTNSISADAVAREVLSTRALLEAESAAQRFVQTIAPGATCPANVNNWALTPGCTSTVTCTSVTVQTINYFTVTAQGSCGVGSDLAVRRVEVRLR